MDGENSDKSNPPKKTTLVSTLHGNDKASLLLASYKDN